MQHARELGLEVAFVWLKKVSNATARTPYSTASAFCAAITLGKENDMIGLMGVSDNGTLYTPSNRKLFRMPLRLAIMVQKAQHWIARKTW